MPSNSIQSTPNTQAETQPVKPPRKSRNPYKNASAEEKHKAANDKLEQVVAAKVVVGNSAWLLADSLAALVQVYRQCYPRPLSAKQLKGMTSIDLDASRLQRYAKLSKFFPPELRRPGIGIRVYEAAYKANNALKRAGWKPFTATEISEMIDDTTGAWDIRYWVEANARRRDQEQRDELTREHYKECLDNPAIVVVNKKAWLKAIEAHPPSAVASAIATYTEDDSRFTGAVNSFLQKINSP